MLHDLKNNGDSFAVSIFAIKEYHVEHYKN